MDDTEEGGEVQQHAQPAQSSRARVPVRRWQSSRLYLLKITAWLASGKTPRQASALAQEELGLTYCTANRHVSSALARLQADDKIEPMSSKKARRVAFFEAQIDRALNLKRSFVQNGEVVEYDAPDLRAANDAGKALVALDGLDV